MKNLGELHHFLGVLVTKRAQFGHANHVFTESILQKNGMEEAKSVKIPVSANSKLLKASDESETVHQNLYQSAVGSLLYLTT